MKLTESRQGYGRILREFERLQTSSDLGRSLSVVITEMKTRIKELDSSLGQSREENGNLVDQVDNLKLRLDRSEHAHADDTTSMQQSIDLLTSQLKLKDSESSNTLSLSLQEAKLSNEKLLVNMSSLERKVHSCELVIAQDVASLRMKDSLISDLKQQCMESSKTFQANIHVMESEMKEKSIELETMRLENFRHELRIAGLEQDLLHSRTERSGLQLQLSSHEKAKQNSACYMKELEDLQSENNRLKALNMKIISRTLTSRTSCLAVVTLVEAYLHFHSSSWRR